MLPVVTLPADRLPVNVPKLALTFPPKTLPRRLPLNVSAITSSAVSNKNEPLPPPTLPLKLKATILPVKDSSLILSSNNKAEVLSKVPLGPAYCTLFIGGLLVTVVVLLSLLLLPLLPPLLAIAEIVQTPPALVTVTLAPATIDCTGRPVMLPPLPRRYAAVTLPLATRLPAVTLPLETMLLDIMLFVVRVCVVASNVRLGLDARSRLALAN